MEPNHFSHKHGLVFQQLPQGSNIDCSGCKSPASGGVYPCRQCNFFLHPHCFGAPRSLDHPSHPLHPLTLMPSPTYPSSSFICNSCNLFGHGFSYSCSLCQFDIHLHCSTSLMPPFPQPNAANADQSMIKHFSHPHALKQMEIRQHEAKACSACSHRLLTGSAYRCTEPYCTFTLHKPCFDSPRELRHHSHPHHDLTLHTSTLDGGLVTCNACLKHGEAFAYTCGGACNYSLHVECAQWPETLTRPDHKHPLKLFYSSPYAEVGGEAAVFVCSACWRVAGRDEWVYYCGRCDFGTHLECVRGEIKQEFSAAETEEIEEELARLLGQKVSLDELREMARQREEEERREEEAYVRKMEMEEELRRRRHSLALQRLQQASESIDFMGQIG